MKGKLGLAAAGLVGLVAGFILGRGVPVEPGGKTPEALSPGRLPASAGKAERHVGGDRGNHDLAMLLKWRQRREFGDAGIVRELERMDEAAIKALMLDLASAMKDAGQEEAASMRSIIATAAKELYRREGEASLEWAAGLEDYRGLFLTNLISAAAYDSPELAKAWIDRYREEFGKGMMSTFAYQAIKGATGRGAEDLIRLKELYGKDLSGASFPIGPYPEGFDFQRLFTGAPRGQGWGMANALQYWAAKDKEAAWNGVKQAIEGDGKAAAGRFGSLFQGVAAMEGNGKAAEWIVAKLDLVPEEYRMTALASLRTDGLMDAGGAEAVMKRLPDEPSRVQLAAALISPFSVNPAGIAALKMLSSEEARVDAFLSALDTYEGIGMRGQETQARKMREIIGTMVDSAELSPLARERVMAGLSSPE